MKVSTTNKMLTVAINVIGLSAMVVVACIKIVWVVEELERNQMTFSVHGHSSCSGLCCVT